MTGEETGFHEIPWDLEVANAGSLDGLPPKTPDDDPDGECCQSEWVGPTDQPGETPWLCCRPAGHAGTHRGSDSVSTVAEWGDQDAKKDVAR